MALPCTTRASNSLQSAPTERVSNVDTPCKRAARCGHGTNLTRSRHQHTSGRSEVPPPLQAPDRRIMTRAELPAAFQLRCVPWMYLVIRRHTGNRSEGGTLVGFAVPESVRFLQQHTPTNTSQTNVLTAPLRVGVMGSCKLLDFRRKIAGSLSRCLPRSSS